MIWSLFRTAVLAAVDERARAQRQARDLTRIAQALEDLVDDGRARLDDGTLQGSPPKGK